MWHMNAAVEQALAAAAAANGATFRPINGQVCPYDPCPEFLSREIPDTESYPGVAWHNAVQAAFTGCAAHSLKQPHINTAIFKGPARFTRKNSRSSQYQQCRQACPQVSG